jgi:hypothetical protein
MSIQTNITPLSQPGYSCPQPPPNVVVIHEGEPGGMFAKILYHTRLWYPAARITAAALAALLTIGAGLLSMVMFHGDHTFRLINATLMLVFPVIGMYEATSFLDEAQRQSLL